MPIAAVPKYLGQDFSEASPGLRFGMYLKLWGVNRRSDALLWTTHDVDYEVRNHQEREVRHENKVSALSHATSLREYGKSTLLALFTRQKHCFDSIGSGESVLRLEAQSIAPFTTGLGNEHPLENGFAFLNPYGVPYLPGSGVKGVLRQAARELASGDWGDAHGWDGGESLSIIDILFGLESKDGDAEHLRGTLTFWDVIPQINGDSLMVEIMTPHQKHYYQGCQSPHDSGQPTLISFLTVPPGAGFTFHVQCDLRRLQRLAPELATDCRWKKLIETAFEHAFQWLGFGAKTAVGYGAMKQDERARQERAEAAAKQAEKERRASLSEAERDIETLRNQIAASNKGQGKGARLFSAVRETVGKAAGWSPAEREALKSAARQALEHLGLKKDDIKKELRPLSDASA